MSKFSIGPDLRFTSGQLEWYLFLHQWHFSGLFLYVCWYFSHFYKVKAQYFTNTPYYVKTYKYWIWAIFLTDFVVSFYHYVQGNDFGPMGGFN